MFGLSMWHGGSNVSGSTCSDIIFCVVTLFIVWSSEFSWGCELSSSSTFSRCPLYSPMLNVTYLLLWFDTKILTDDLPLILCIPFTMFRLGSFPFVDSWLLRKHAVYPVFELPLILIGMMLLCLGGILSVDLAIPIVAFCLQFWVYVRNLPSFWI